MIESKKITLISIILILITLVFTLGLWLYSLNCESDSEIYGDTKVIYTKDDVYDKDIINEANLILAKNNKIKSDSSEVYVDDNSVYISVGGYYRLNGNFENIVVESSDSRPVVLILDNAYIESSQKPPIYVYRATKCIVSTVENTDNYIVDKRKKYSETDKESAIYSIPNLTFNGEGNLYIEGNYQGGVYSKRNVKLVSGKLDVTAVNEGIKAENIFSRGGEISINSEGDSIKAKKKNNKGIVAFNGGNFKIKSENDAVNSNGEIFEKNTTLNIATGKGAENSKKLATRDLETETMPPELRQETQETEQAVELPSMKGLKADKGIYIDSGDVTFDTDDDAIHSDEEIILNNGKFQIASGDDAVHSDGNVTVNNGNISITHCYEGLEGKYIEINDGDINIIALDDGINAVGDGTSIMEPPPDNKNPSDAPSVTENNPDNRMLLQMQVEDNENTVMLFRMNGGKVYIEAGGDGIDINGSCEMNGGDVTSYAKKDGPDLAWDYDGICRMNGGTFKGAGNAGMMEMPADKSKKYCLMAYMPTTYRNGGNIKIIDSDGNEVENFSTDGSFCWVGWYGDNVKPQETYTMSVNDVVIGSAKVEKIISVIGAENTQNNAPPDSENGQPPPKPDGNMVVRDDMQPPSKHDGDIGTQGKMQPPAKPGGNMGAQQNGMQPPPKPNGNMGNPQQVGANSQMGDGTDKMSNADNELSNKNKTDEKSIDNSNTKKVIVLSVFFMVLVIISIFVLKKMKRQF